MKKIRICFIILVSIFLLCSCLNESGDYLVSKGFSQFEKENYHDAIVYFNEAIEVGTKEYSLVEMYSALGRCYIELDMYNEGIIELKKAIEMMTSIS
ncbi:tetratricopeptide repeat protein [Abyssisolibacter fermentans]|uniref:tetratricopeptide repeat protein n=1 Tax=Abyssisolibacter fermentans TaxID=1766203 RepID=UPI000834FD15|nr:tetratricopeptide repeat protein [Abyssisolibacter fermentans]